MITRLPIASQPRLRALRAWSVSARRLCRLASALSFGTVVLSVVTVACQKVPLLAPTGSTISLTPTASALPLSGTADLVAQVVQAGGTAPQSGTHVIFTTTLGTVQPSDCQTDTTGRCTVRFLAGTTSGTATITASSGGATVGDKGAVKIAIGAAAVGRVGVAGNPTTVSASGGNSLITASVFDVNGNVLPNLPVTFSTTAGAVQPAVATTDPSGNASTTLTTNKQATVTATAGVSGSTGGGTGTSSNSGTVQINVNVAATVQVTATPNPVIAGQIVALAIIVTPAASGSSVRSLVVDFGDGTEKTYGGGSQTVTKVYNTPRTYLVTVKAIDVIGDVGLGTAAVNVNPMPQVAVTVSSNTTNPAPNQLVTFTITATPTTGNAISSVFVDFFDGTTQSFPGNVTTTSHAFAVGNYTITVTATDTSGAQGRGSLGLVVR